MPSAESLFSDFFFSLANMTVIQFIDIVLVAAVFFMLLYLLRRRRATVLLRGTLVVAAVFFVFAVFLPLPTFDFLLQVGLIAILVATPVIFQPELRRVLEELGNRVGSLSFRRMAAETTMKPVVRAVENLSEKQTGALIVLEGTDDLSDVRATGVPVGAQVTSELLQTVFYDGTPLHDGAVVIRNDRVLAAGCVLPVSNRQLYTQQRRLGTRHRAALGLAEATDALVIVVSEETGQVSVARDGRLHTDVDKTVVREEIHGFFQPGDREEEPFSLSHVWGEFRRWWHSSEKMPESVQIGPYLVMAVVALLLALASWAFVTRETNPVREERVEAIPLEVTEVPPGTQLWSTVPDTVTAVVKSNDATLDALSPDAFQARASLDGLEPGLHRVQVVIVSSIEPVRTVSVEPPVLNIELVEVVTKSVPVRAITTGEDALSPALAVEESPITEPAEVAVTGGAPAVERVDHAIAELPLPNAAGLVRRVVPVTPVNADGLTVGDIAVEPAQVRVEAQVVQRANARDAGIRVVTSGELPAGYRLENLTSEPNRVTLIGDPDALAQTGGVVDTIPVDLSRGVDDFSVQLPLDLPLDAEAVNDEGETVRSVLVQVDVGPRTANLVFSRTVELVGSPGLDVMMEPATVDVIVNGPVPTLNEIEAQPSLLRVLIEAAALADLEPGATIPLTPTVVYPEGTRVQLIPETVSVTVEEVTLHSSQVVSRPW